MIRCFLLDSVCEYAHRPAAQPAVDSVVCPNLNRQHQIAFNLKNQQKKQQSFFVLIKNALLMSQSVFILY